MATLHWALRAHLKDLRDDGRLALLTALILHANIRMRCWASTDLLISETGWSRVPVVAAKKWLGEHGAFVLVPFRKRVDEELKLPRRQHVYQLTGILRLDGETVPYLFLSPEAVSAVEAAVQAAESIPAKSLPSKSSVGKSLASKPKGSSLSKGDSLLEGGTQNNNDVVVNADYAEVAKVFENEIGLLSQFIGQELKDLLTEYPKDWCIDAIRVAVTANKRNLNYVRGVLRNWKANGRGFTPKPEPSPAAPETPAASVQTEFHQKIAAALAAKKGVSDGSP